MRDSWLRMHRTRNPIPPTFDSWPIQLGLNGDPWRVIVACRMLNRTTGDQVRPVLRMLLERWPTALDLAFSPVHEVEDIVRPLGLYRARSQDMVYASYAFLFDEWSHPTQLPGVGRYCYDALRIFCLGDETVEPEDKVLRSFLEAIRCA